MKHTPYNSQHIPPQAPANHSGFWAKMARTGRHFPFTRNNHHVSLRKLVSRKPSALKKLSPTEESYNERQIDDITFPWWGLIYYHSVTCAKYTVLYAVP
ncbi:hypothetical protein [Photobacterium angustum]|uniref:hypothetical protein n=1 Tax=Photobacterium angustum TaxID=661 RepID=UPI001FC97BA7|nr:hypothetical protein [Photobacterium angustum]